MIHFASEILGSKLYWRRAVYGVGLRTGAVSEGVWSLHSDACLLDLAFRMAYSEQTHRIAQLIQVEITERFGEDRERDEQFKVRQG